MCTYIYVPNIPIFCAIWLKKCDFLTQKLGIKKDPDPKLFIPDPDPSKSSGSDRIRIHNTTYNCIITHVQPSVEEEEDVATSPRKKKPAGGRASDGDEVETIQAHSSFGYDAFSSTSGSAPVMGRLRVRTGPGRLRLFNIIKL